jgi:diacylglycerol kinase (CTP)
MSLPASDAFSLSHDQTHLRLSNSLRATSPKIPFVSGTQSRTLSYSTVNPRKTIRPRTSRSHSMGDPTAYLATANRHSNEAHSAPTDEHKPRSRSPHAARLQRRRTSGQQQVVPVPVAVVRSQSSSPSAAPVDWEIPRKMLHSSIGAFV